MMFQDTGKLLISAGIFLIITGLIFLFWHKMPFIGKLPGDIIVEKKNFGLFFPLASCIVISLLLTALVNFIIWILKK